jgi:hypothetical protein
MFSLKKILISFLFFIKQNDAHGFLKYPLARRSPYSSYYVENDLVNYNIASPLYASEGFTFPCKGFPKGPSITTIKEDSFIAQIESGAPHDGKHCQFGFTNDQKTFVVTKIVFGTCLIPDGFSYNIDIPKNMPDGDITFFWTWINAVGNREYYMDCADIRLERGVEQMDNIVRVKGKELVIVNILNYPIIPEFPDGGDYDGKDLFDKAGEDELIFYKSNVVTTSSSDGIKSTTSRQIPSSQFTSDITNPTTSQMIISKLPTTDIINPMTSSPNVLTTTSSIGENNKTTTNPITDFTTKSQEINYSYKLRSSNFLFLLILIFGLIM